MSWETVKLGDCCVKIGSGSTPKGGATVYIEEGTSLIRSQNVYNLAFDYQGLTHITEDAAKKLSGVTIQERDVLLNITGDSVARVCMVPNDVLPARVNQHVAIIRTNENLLPDYLLYYLASPHMQAYMLNLAVGKGASRNALTKGMIEAFPIPLPSVEEQKSIVKYLSAYDDLIENNQKQIKLLEEAAQRLYKEWFVDLHFPGYENTPIFDGVPQGWTKSTILNLCERMNAGGTPSRKNANYWNDASIKWYKTQELQDCWLVDSEEKISIEGQKNSSAKFFPENTILMAIYASPTLGRLGILDSEATCNQAALCLKADESKISWQWLYEKLYELREHYNGIARGAGQQNISGEVVKQTMVLCPSKEIMDEFTKIVAPWFEKRRKLQKQNIILSEARDRLLPKLMNDKIEV